jgi:hypothetical protein
MAGPLADADGEPGAPTINVKNVDDEPSSLCRGGGGSGLHLGSERCVVNLHGYDTQKVILFTDLILLALGPL